MSAFFYDMNNEKENTEPKKRGNLSQQAIYGKVSARSQEILDVLFALLTDPNRNLRFAAAKTLLNKIVPDLKSVEVGGAVDEYGKRQPIQLYINSGNGFVPAAVQLPTSSAGSAPAISSEIQGISMAQTGTEDHYGYIRDSKTSPS